MSLLRVLPQVKAALLPVLRAFVHEDEGGERFLRFPSVRQRVRNIRQKPLAWEAVA